MLLFPVIIHLLCFCVIGPKKARAAVTFKFLYFDNAEGDFATRGWLSSSSLFQRNLAAVGDMFCQYLDSINVELITHVMADRSIARAGGTFQLGSVRGESNRTGLIVYEPSSLTKLKTGENPFFSHEILLFFNVPYVQENYWLDPTPNNRSDNVIPSTKVDFLSIVLHEIGHGLGYAGSINRSPGANYGKYTDYMTVFDDLSFFGGDGNALDAATGNPNPMYFDGPISKQVYGQKVQLTNLATNDVLSSQNFYHLGDCSSPKILEDSLMSGCYVPLGPEYLEITCADMALLADLGYSMSRKFFDTCIITKAPVVSPMSVPVKAPIVSPVKVPVRAPVVAPLSPPQTAPIRPPTKSPLMSPVVSPMSAPVKAPIVSPVKVPVRAPVVAPFPPPLTTPIRPPTPLSLPGNVPVKSPMKANCGIFGLSFFCPSSGECGFFKRLFKVGICG